MFLVNNGSHRTGFPAATSVRRENNNDGEKKFKKIKSISYY